MLTLFILMYVVCLIDDIRVIDGHLDQHTEASHISREGTSVLIRMRSSVVDGFKPCFYSQWFKLIINGKCSFDVVFATVGALGFQHALRQTEGD